MMLQYMSKIHAVGHEDSLKTAEKQSVATCGLAVPPLLQERGVISIRPYPRHRLLRACSLPRLIPVCKGRRALGSWGSVTILQEGA